MLYMLIIAKMRLGEVLSTWLNSRLLLQQCRGFLGADSGAITVEWVALAAGLVLGCVMISFILMNGLYFAASNIASQLSP